MFVRHLPFLPLSALCLLFSPPVRAAQATLAVNAAGAQAATARIARVPSLANPALRPAAEAMGQGFAPAARDGKAGPFRVPATTAGVADIRAACARAVAAGVVAGPLTRNGGTAPAMSGLQTVPTSPLPIPERKGFVRAPGFHPFGRSAEDKTGFRRDGVTGSITPGADRILHRQKPATGYRQDTVALPGDRRP